MNGVLVVLEAVGDDLAAISRELLGKGRQLADALGGSLAALAIGPTKAIAARAGNFGADQVYTIDAPALRQYTTDGYVAAAIAAVKGVSAGADSCRSQLPDARFGAALATDLGAGLVVDATNIQVVDGALRSHDRRTVGMLSIPIASPQGRRSWHWCVSRASQKLLPNPTVAHQLPS